MPGLYKFTLKFDNALRTMSAEDGLPIDQLAALLQKLHRALDLKAGEEIVLSDVTTGSYAPILTTQSLKTYTKLQVVHRKISKQQIQQLSPDELEYAVSLNKLVQNSGLQLRTEDNKQQELTYEPLEIPEPPKYMFQIGSTQGTITGIGGQSLDGKINLFIDQETFGIEINSDQEKALYPYYKKGVLRMTIEKRLIFETGNMSKATLLDFEVLSEDTFLDNLSKLRTQSGHFGDIDDSVKAVRNIRD